MKLAEAVHRLRTMHDDDRVRCERVQDMRRNDQGFAEDLLRQVEAWLASFRDQGLLQIERRSNFLEGSDGDRLSYGSLVLTVPQASATTILLHTDPRFVSTERFRMILGRPDRPGRLYLVERRRDEPADWRITRYLDGRLLAPRDAILTADLIEEAIATLLAPD